MSKPLRLAVLLAVVTVAAWTVVKPVRALTPALAGVTCYPANVCSDNASRLGEAEDLYNEGVAFIANTLSPLQEAPRVIFCSSEACVETFGLGERSAVTVGGSTVIGPRAWLPHYVRHELIHQLQAEKLGVVGLLFKPTWFVEGMAYSLSEDPRRPLAEPWEGHRSRFEAWFRGMKTKDLWRRAREGPVS